jgi:hypothetical protein
MTARQQYVSAFLDNFMRDVEITDNWRGRTPQQPALDPKFLQQPTPAPQQDILPPDVLPEEVVPPLDDEQ